MPSNQIEASLLPENNDNQNNLEDNLSPTEQRNDQHTIDISNTNSNDNTSITTEPQRIAEPNENPAKSVTVKIGSYGVQSVLTSVNTTANCLIMIDLGAGGACSLSTTYQSLFRNACSGVLLSCGVALGNAVGQGDYQEASESVIASYVLTGLLTLLSSTAYGATYFIFPKIFAEETAHAASTYLLWSGLGTWSSLALITTGQIAFQAGDWKSPLASTIAYRLPAAGLSYLLAKNADLGVKGIGIGNFITPWIAYAGMELWLHRQQFDRFRQAEFSKAIVLRHLKSLANRGFQMSTQKLTEWLNLLAITTLLARMSDTILTMINSSTQLMNFFNLFSQGVGQGGNMILATTHATLKKQIAQYKENPNEATLAEIKALQKSIITTSVKTYGVGMVINIASALTLYFARKQITDWFIADSADKSIKDTSETILWINGLGLIADSMRIISGCILNTWDKILLPNIVSLVLMTGIGIPLNYLVAKDKDHDYAATSMFILRNITILLAAIINTFMLYQCIKADQKEIDALTQATENTNQEDDTRTSNSLATLAQENDRRTLSPTNSSASFFAPNPNTENTEYKPPQIPNLTEETPSDIAGAANQ